MSVELDEQEYERLKQVDERSSLLDESSGVGLWQAILHNADAMHPESKWTWSPEFRRLIGYSSEADFPDVVGSWADKLHPDDAEATFAAFAGHLTDRTGTVRYNVTYRLMMRDGTYRWFRATGGCQHMPDGQIRACGSLFDIHDAVTLRLRTEKEAAEDAEAIEQLGVALGALARGDLTRHLTHDMPSKMQRVKDDFNTTVTSLADLMSTVARTVQEAGSSATEVRDSSSSLSARSSSQASSIEETSAAVVEITSTVKQTAELAQESAKSAEGSREKSATCGETVKKAINAMSEIEKSSGAIGSIIGTIENIAFQTNMLALNASVEAARAGDAGRGFAVVAAEVRNLAQRSTEAAKEINQLVTEAKTHVSNGVGLVKNTGVAIDDIAQEANKIADTIASISQAANEQSVALSEIERAVSDLDQLTQKNSTMAHQNEGAASQMADSVSTLASLISRFVVPQPGEHQRHVA